MIKLKKINLFSLLLLLLFGILCQPLVGQNKKADIPVVEFRNRTFITDIPYGRPFIINTSTSFDGKPSNICALKIWRAGAAANDTLYAYDWIGKGEQRTKFEMKVNKGLKLDKSYHFEFVYLMEESYSPDQKVLQKIIHRSRQFYKQHRRGITGYDVDTLIGNIESELVSDSLITNISFGANGRWTLQAREVNLFRFPVTTSKGVVEADDFALLAREQAELEIEQEEKKRLMIDLRSNQNEYAALLEELADNHSQLAEPLNRVKNFVESGNYKNTSKFDVIKIREIQCDSACEQTLRSIAALYLNTLKVERQIAAHSGEIKYLNDKIGTLSEIVVEGVRVSGIFTRESKVTIEDKATLDKVKIGTAFGGSFAFPNTNSIDNIGDPSTFGYFALKFYLKPVDRGLKDPYLSDTPILNRTSVFVGLKALGNLEYKGTELENIFGTQPVFGISYDIHRNFSIDIGTVLFRQASVYPLIDKSSPPRAAFTIGLSFDPDLINRFRALFTDDKYSID